jgi:glutathione S-transferase
MITVHHLERSRSHRVVWLLEELGLPYELVTYHRAPGTDLAPPELEAIHPLGKSPVIQDGELVVAESGAILEHLVETHGGGALVPPAGTPARRDYRYFMHYAEGSMMPFLVMQFVFHKIKTAKLPFFIKPVARKIAGTVGATYLEPNLRRHLAFVGAHLDRQPWFAGDELTVADIQMSYPIEAAVSRASHLGVPASVTRFVERIRARPAYQRASERTGPAHPEL